MAKLDFPLFPNQNKKSDKSPDYRFSHKKANGEWLDVAVAWKKISKNGNSFLSVSISEEAYQEYIEDQNQANDQFGTDEDGFPSVDTSADQGEDLPF